MMQLQRLLQLRLLVCGAFFLLLEIFAGFSGCSLFEQAVVN
jgi:hypothetical protein